MIIPTAMPPTSGAGQGIFYYTQSGDTLPAIASRFGVASEEITAQIPIPPTNLLDPGTLLVVPDRLGQTTPSVRTIPDAEVVFSPASLDFDTSAYADEMGGRLSAYRDYLMSEGTITGAEAVDKIALENSVNPRLMLGLLEYESQWVSGEPDNLAKDDFPLGWVDYRYRGLFRQMMWAERVLADGYYGWRSGKLTDLTFADGRTVRLSPELNAGTAAIQYYFAQRYSKDYDKWAMAIDPNIGFPALYNRMFGDPWQRAAAVDPLFPAGLTQPQLALPFIPGQVWAYTGGPHSAWEREGGAQAALDFAPSSDAPGCLSSPQWVVAPAPGLVTRSGNGVVALDLDFDGQEQTGWVILFLHVATKGRVREGTLLNQDDLIGHPSCEGGVSSGTHVHIVRKYNGEWILADGPLPFNLDGWISHAGERAYKGTLTRGDRTLEACTCGSFETQLIREKNASQ
jgi:murein DD-endopeptidase MepM/ murein hydrolase activator NlpD